MGAFLLSRVRGYFGSIKTQEKVSLTLEPIFIGPNFL